LLKDRREKREDTTRTGKVPHLMHPPPCWPLVHKGRRVVTDFIDSCADVL